MAWRTEGSAEAAGLIKNEGRFLLTKLISANP